ncbi:MAG TPA: proton-conducting transporter membrane subunit, partial [Planctomycetota bacterium]|nr:proton-conducting transporter membrane subunit [Planctomycetota bacterium]
LLVGMAYERRHSRLIADYGGVAKVMPRFTAIFLVVTFASIALPLTNGFVGEFLILAGAFKAAPVAACFAVVGAVLGAWYMLGAVKRVFFGPLTDPHNAELKDVSLREGLLAAPFVLAIVLTGVKPEGVLALMRPGAERIESQAHRSALPRPADAAAVDGAGR